MARRKRKYTPRKRKVTYTLRQTDPSRSPGGRITRNDLDGNRRPPVRRQGSRSSNVYRVDYDISNRQMTVTYRRRAGDAQYTYFGVPMATFRNFKKRASPGKFVWRNIRRPPRFVFRRNY